MLLEAVVIRKIAKLALAEIGLMQESIEIFDCDRQFL